ncbi:MAG TPA: response regulator transcription factor [Longimicrobium sp.]
MVRILLADDHEMVRAGLRSLLDGSEGMEVVGEARNGAEAFRMACELKPDVAVLDVSMPDMGGPEAAEKLARECPAVRVLALTMHDDRAHLTRMLEAGAAGYVLKRAAADELVRAIRVVAAGGTYVDPTLAGRMLRTTSPSRGIRDAPSPETLSGREEEVLRRIAWGQSNKQIAAELEISTKTVETYKARISDKLGLRSRTEMVRYALQQGWLADE